MVLLDIFTIKIIGSLNRFERKWTQGCRLVALKSVKYEVDQSQDYGCELNESWWIVKGCSWLVLNQMKEVRDMGDYGAM